MKLPKSEIIQVQNSELVDSFMDRIDNEKSEKLAKKSLILNSFHKSKEGPQMFFQQMSSAHNGPEEKNSNKNSIMNYNQSKFWVNSGFKLDPSVGKNL